MASNVKVVATDFRQATIKVTPGTYLTEVLEEACKKFKVPHEKHMLKHKQKQLDLSNTFRSSGLVPGAKLELVAKSKSPSVLNIALELPESEAKLFGNRRATEKLPSDYTLWKVLRHFESETCKGKGVNLTDRGVPQMNASGNNGQLYYETPVLQIEQRSLSTFVDFQKTMSQLGYNGGAVLVRLSFQKTDKTLADAMSVISEYFKEEAKLPHEEIVDDVAAKAENEAVNPSTDEPPTPAPHPHESPSSVTTQQVVAAETSSIAEPDLMEIDSEPTSTDPMEPLSIFAPPSNSVPAAALTTDSDDIFVPSIAHAQLYQQGLKHKGQNKRLLSDKEIEENAAAEAAKLAAIKSLTIRVRFPGNSSATWAVQPHWDGAMLYKAIRQVMNNPGTPFKLIVPGIPSTTIQDDETNLIKGHGLTRNTSVDLAWLDVSQVRDQPFLKEKAAAQAQEIKVPEVPKGEEEQESESGQLPQQQQQQPKPGGGDRQNKGIPKWLKKGLGKK
ncbi:GLUT4 regulating protein TUG-domain-containing protein [Xylariales sp. AK1849]|nr:GLUT4 regulating protein TUG-domain-containing protein [Xylariales sp. AK1849]